MNDAPTGILSVRLPLWLVAPLLIVAMLGAAGGGLLAGYLLNRPAATCPESPEICAEFAVFWEAWDLARDHYVEPEAADPEAMTAGAINGMLSTLGDEGHTRFLTAEEARLWDEALQGSFEGIGAYIAVRNGQTVIVAPIEGSPAEKAGLRPGDVILAVDGESTEGWTVDDLRTAVRGPKGTDVTLRVLHPNETKPVELVITRVEVEVPSVSWRMLPDNVALIKLSSFDEDAGHELKNALTAAKEQGARTLILDLRNNPGGLLNQAILVASQFLPGGTPVLLQENRDGQRKTTSAEDGGVATDLPLVVLINENSASSSEIVAGALQDAGRATLIGETTFGTGTVLSQYQLSDGSRLLLGTEQWLTPAGREIRGQGIEPDEIILLPDDVAPLTPAEAAELSAAALRNGPDAQLGRALELATAAASR